MIFVCENCNCLASTKNIFPNVKDNTHPNMTLEDMQGEANRSINILDLKGYQNYLDSGEINRLVIDPDSPSRDLVIEDFEPLMYKYFDMVLMLCSECNTGIWSEHFEKIEACKDVLTVSRNDLYKSVCEDENIEETINYIKGKL